MAEQPPPKKRARLPSKGRASINGVDADGTRYKSAEELWDKEKTKGLDKWYCSAIEYWNTVPATIDGTLGGFGDVSPADLMGSGRFLDALADAGYSTRHGGLKGRAVDCGAGVGRITAGLLTARFRRVDVVEPVARMMQQAKATLATLGHRGEFHEVGLESFDAAPGSYDCIWIQVTGGVWWVCMKV
jgi:protein N-terminal methyltransferase